MTSQLTKTNTDFIGTYEIDKLIKKFSHSMKNNNENSSPISNAEHNNHCNQRNNNRAQQQLPGKHNNKGSPLKNASYNKLIENVCQENTNTYSNSKPKGNSYSEQAASDRAKFFSTLKSLFAIFDPESRGFIDINELNNLGAQKNEILNDVIGYLQNKRGSNYEYSNNLYFVNGNGTEIKTSASRSSSGNSSR
jgi:hypothetical protein